MGMVQSAIKNALQDVHERNSIDIRNTVMAAIAEHDTRFMPPPPPVLTLASLRPVSTISVHPSRLRALRVFSDMEDASFTCPEQALMLELMIQGKESVLGILGTGTGKTTMVMLNAAWYGEGKVTVVVLPLSSLRADLRRRCKKIGVTISDWMPNNAFDPNVSIMMVAIEYLGTQSFIKYDF